MANVNIKQIDLLEYLVDKFNENSFGIPFRMGTYERTNDDGLVIYAPMRDNNGKFDEAETLDEDTYQVGKRSFVVMGGTSNNGDYTALPNVQLVAFDVDLEFLVYIDNPISEIIRMAIEETRDNLIGALDTITIKERDLTDEDADPDDVDLRVVTTADSIDFGETITIKKRNYMLFSLGVSMTVSKNIDFGNQVKWNFLKNIAEDDCVEPTRDPTEDDYDEEVLSEDYSVWTAVETDPISYADDFEGFDLGGSLSLVRTTEFNPTVETVGTAGEHIYSYEDGNVYLCDGMSGSDYLWAIHGGTWDVSFPNNGFNTEKYYYDESLELTYVSDANGKTVNLSIASDPPFPFADLEWEFVSVPVDTQEVIPLIASWGTNQDQESFQTLRPYTGSTQKYIDRAKEVHNYVKSRGFGATFTLLLDTSQQIIKTLFKETFQKLIKPNVYTIGMVMKEFDGDTGEFVDSTDLTFERDMIFGEAEVGDIVYGEPIIFSIGFTPSAKDV